MGRKEQGRERRRNDRCEGAGVEEGRECWGRELARNGPNETGTERGREGRRKGGNSGKRERSKGGAREGGGNFKGDTLRRTLASIYSA